MSGTGRFHCTGIVHVSFIVDLLHSLNGLHRTWILEKFLHQSHFIHSTSQHLALNLWQMANSAELMCSSHWPTFQWNGNMPFALASLQRSILKSWMLILTALVKTLVLQCLSERERQPCTLLQGSTKSKQLTRGWIIETRSQRTEQSRKKCQHAFSSHKQTSMHTEKSLHRNNWPCLQKLWLLMQDQNENAKKQVPATIQLCTKQHSGYAAFTIQ